MESQSDDSEIIVHAAAQGYLAADGTVTAAGLAALTPAELYNIEQAREAVGWTPKASEATAAPTSPETAAPAATQPKTEIAIPTDAPLEAVIASVDSSEVLQYIDQLAEDPLVGIPDDDPWAPLERAAWSSAAKICLQEGLKPDQQEAFVKHLMKTDKLRDVAFGLAQGSTTAIRAAARAYARR